mgnify:FL=1|tara:strand:- start:10384 stop:11160 length:777 start_codon:yes stop_codon:yes gene_type:complete
MKQTDIDFIMSIQDIGTSKFNTQTYKENIKWKKENNKSNYTITTLMTPICDRIPTDKGVFILEMNNETNQIEGIGIVRNFPVRCEDHGVKIYDNDYFNSYIYHGKFHISRKKILKRDDWKVLKYLEHLVFKGSKHLKRGWNHSCFSLKKERISSTPPFKEFVSNKSGNWYWKNKKKDIRRCSVCHRKKDEKHRQLLMEINKNKNKIPKTCNLTPIFSFKKYRCDSCGEIKRGHICPNIKKDVNNYKIVFTFLRNLFIK